MPPTARSAKESPTAPTARRSHRRRHFVPLLAETADADRQQVDAWVWAERISIVGLFVFALGVVAYVMQGVLVPVLLAWVVTTILYPLVDRLVGVGLPRVAASILVALAFLVIVLCLFGAFSLPLAYWVGRTAELGELLRSKLHLITQPLALFDDISKALGEVVGAGDPAVSIDTSTAGIVRGILSTLTPVVTEFLLFFGALVFYLVFQREVRRAVAYLFTDGGARRLVLTILADIDRNMTRYFGTCAVVNLCIGTITALLAYLVGLPQPLLWGVLAAVMNFIPYLGVALVVATLFVIGVLSFPTLGQALVAPIAYIAITTVEGQFVTPSIVGHRLTLNPFLLFIAIAFWTWMWGPIGAFLAVPLVIVGVVVGRHLLGDPEAEPPSAPPASG